LFNQHPSTLLSGKKFMQCFNKIKLLLMVLFCTFATNVFADNDVKITVDTPAQAQDEFLEVTDAFRIDSAFVGDDLQLHWKIAPGYYLYQERFKLKTSNDLVLSPTFSQGVLKHDSYAEKDMTVYHDDATLTVKLPANTQPFSVQIAYQGCADAGLCYPPHKSYFKVDPTNHTVTPTDTFEAGSGGSADVSTTAASEAQAAVAPSKYWLLQAMFFAVLGGMILNLMPCVFPVLSLKVMSLAQAERSHIVKHGWVYTAGIVLCFLVFASILLIARAGGEAIGWGFQLQSPMLITALAYLFFVMGLSMSGMINIGTSWMGAGQSLTEKSGLTGSFFTGVLAAVVASPCTAPFMGAALGFALTQPGFVSLLVFASLGFGMALPMLILCYVPALANRLPRPGAWMEVLKEILAFPLYLTAIWLLWVLGRQAGVNTLITVCAGGVLLAFSLWLLNRDAKGVAQYLRRGLIGASWVIAIALPWNMINGAKDDSSIIAYTPESLQEARATGKPVFVNLTADWCITCLANERVALGTDDVKNAFKDANVVSIKGDWTNRDPHITELLNEYQRSGVPLYLYFPPNQQGKGQLLPQILTKSMLLDVVKNKSI
jgi:thiol:disulfide interchange protein